MLIRVPSCLTFCQVSNTKIIIAVDVGNKSEELDIPDHCWVVKLANTVTYDRMDQAVERMRKIVLGIADANGNVPAPNSLQRVLFGLSRPSDPEDVGGLQWFNPLSLNESQKKAVRLALISPELALIHGPPGVRTFALTILLANRIARQERLIPSSK